MTADTNVLVYVHDGHDRKKQATASKVVGELMRRNSYIGLQCIGEFTTTLVRKLRAAPWDASQESRNLLVSFLTFPPTETAALSALAAVAAGRSSYWDALLIHSAAEAGHTVIFTEDRQHSTTIAGVEIVNPFNEAGGLSDRAQELLGL